MSLGRYSRRLTPRYREYSRLWQTHDMHSVSINIRSVTTVSQIAFAYLKIL